MFSTKFDDDGNPQGIGLSVWRFNIGAGSARQGEDSGIRDPWRRAESFLLDNGTYDWTKQAGQQWFMHAAKERGAEQFIGFVNSPPIALTKNGMAYGDGSGGSNLPKEKYDDFAEYLVTLNEHFAQSGIPFDYLSPVNEPQWNWSLENGQEGCPWQNPEFAKMQQVLDSAIVESGQDVKIEIPETARLDFIYNGDLDGRNSQAQYFFGKNSRVKNLPSLAKKVAAHSYFTTWPTDSLIHHRREVRKSLAAIDPDLEYWMSEYCILADNEEIRGNGRDLGMDPALYIARVIHADLTIANAASWQWWLAVSPYEYKDGLVYIDKDTSDGKVYESKLLWTLGNYSRFIRPGAVRIGVERSDNAQPEEYMRSGILASAYLNEGGGEAIVVIVNNSEEPREVQLNFAGYNASIHLTPYVTSAESDLERGAAISSGEIVGIPPRSVVTFIGTL